MSSNQRDANRVPNISGVSSITFTGTIEPAVNPITHAMLVEASFAPGFIQDTNLTEVGGVAISLGQTTMSASFPVTIASDQTALPISNALSAAPANGQAKIAVSGTAVQLGTNTLKNGAIVTAKTTNTANITIGTASVTNTVDGTGNGYILAPGASASWAVTNTNVLYINGTAGDIISWAGS